MKKIHLGCGNTYLPGYVNIDSSRNEGAIRDIKADLYADVRELEYQSGSVDEVRSHHLLEHFSRQEALVLLAQWHDWLRVGGRLVIETPDISLSALLYPFVPRSIKMRLIRHLYGSQEADWAFHKDAYSPGKFKLILDAFGFKGISVKRRVNRRITPNVLVRAKKSDRVVNYRTVIGAVLKRSLIVDEDETFTLWMDEVDRLLSDKNLV